MRLLLAEDDTHLRNLLAQGLREHAYAVDAVSNGEAALAQLEANTYDGILLDILMPKGDGLFVCAELRRRGVHTPVLMLTARDGIHDRVAGLDAGADDYLIKPFAFDELLARVRALLRRRGEFVPLVITVGDLEVDTRKQVARRAGRTIRLAAKEYAFLEYLARNAGRVVSRSELAAHVWDDSHEPVSNLLDVYVSRLRRKLDVPGHPPLIHVRRNSGILLADQERLSDAEV